MKPETKVVHAGDRKKAGPFVPVTTPIYTATTYLYDQVAQLDRILGQEETGPSYARYQNPTTVGLEDLLQTLESGSAAFACASGMSALYLALLGALVDRKKSILAGSMLYGASIQMLNTVFEPMGCDVRYVDICNLEAVEAALAKHQPSCLLMETVTNPLLRVGAMDRIAELTKGANAGLIVDNTFATPMLVRPLELGANLVVHSTTKYLAGHGDAMGGAVITDAAYAAPVRALSRNIGPVLGPFESYLTMRGVKTLALRMERQCQNAAQVAGWLVKHPQVERVYSTSDPAHPDAATIARLFPPGLQGAMVAFELKNAGREQVFAFMERLQLVVRATSLGDVHTMVLYPAIASHRDIAPKQRERLGIRDSLVRLSVGIEAVEDVVADLDQALRG